MQVVQELRTGACAATAAQGCKRVQRFGICPLLTCHWHSGNDRQLCGGHLVKTSTRHGLDVDIRNVSNWVAQFYANLEPIWEFGILQFADNFCAVSRQLYYVDVEVGKVSASPFSQGFKHWTKRRSAFRKSVSVITRRGLGVCSFD